MSVYGWRFAALGLLKLVSDSLNFAGPMLLNALVGYAGAERPRHPPAHHGLLPERGSAAYGFAAAAALTAAATAKAFLNAHYSFGQAVLAAKAKAALGAAVFGATLSTRAAPAAAFSDGDVTTLASVDADRAAGLFATAHELWSLPLQILVALALLYTQVRFAFLAGLAVVLAVVPANRALASRIEAASARMLAWKGVRLAAVGDVLRGATAVKAAGWEPAFAARVRNGGRGRGGGRGWGWRMA